MRAMLLDQNGDRKLSQGFHVDIYGEFEKQSRLKERCARLDVVGNSLLERQVGRGNRLGIELLLLNNLTNGREIDRLLQNRKHRQRNVVPNLAEAFEKRRFASTKNLHAAAELAFLQGKKRPHAIVRVGGVQIDEDDIGIVVLDILADARAVDEFNR